MTTFLIVLALWTTPAQQAQPCQGIAIVQNGVRAFSTGTSQIGPYTDVFSYVLGGIEYIDRRCGIRLTADYFLP